MRPENERCRRCRAAAVAANPTLTIGQLMQAARISSGFAMRAIAAQRAAQDRAVKLLRHLLANGPKHGDHIEAAAEAADISEPALIAAAETLGVRTRKGHWWLPSPAAKQRAA